MKIHVVSDIHLEFGNFKARNVGQDLTILAGDIGEGPRARNLVDEYKKIAPVWYVMGNHEYYHHSIAEVQDYWREQGVFRDRDVIVQDGVVIAFCTLWSALSGRALIMAQDGMNDYRQIKYAGRTLRAVDTNEFHERDVAWLATLSMKPDVVVTHHAPSLRSIHLDRYGDTPLNLAYATDLEWLIRDLKPQIWIHGHTHQSEDYRVGDTRIISNARGYAGPEENRNFNPDYTIDIEHKNNESVRTESGDIS